MRALQALVIFLGILIVIGLTLVVVLMVQGPRAEPVAAAPTDGRLILPAGFRIVEMTAAGDRVVLRIDAADGRQRLVVLDPASGAMTRLLDIGTAP